MKKRPPDQSVWDEPALSSELAGEPPPEAQSYCNWLQEARARTSADKTWIVTVAASLLAGPWAILGAILGSLETATTRFFLIVVFGPLVEEIMKIAIPLLVVERAPHLFRRGSQILLCAFSGGLLFACIENLIYLNIYVPDPSPGLTLWRWTACVALHSFCSLLGGWGVLRIWRDTWRRMDRPRLGLAVPPLAAAAVIHGAYNGLATFWQVFHTPVN